MHRLLNRRMRHTPERLFEKTPIEPKRLVPEVAHLKKLAEHRRKEAEPPHRPPWHVFHLTLGVPKLPSNDLDQRAALQHMPPKMKVRKSRKSLASLHQIDGTFCDIGQIRPLMRHVGPAGIHDLLST